MKKATIKKVSSLLLVMVLALGFTANTFAQYDFLGSERINGGDFAGDSISSAWGTYLQDFLPTTVTADIDASTGELAITNIQNTDGTVWHVQLFQVLSATQRGLLMEGGTYELTFDARTTADSTRDFRVYFGQDAEPFANQVAEGTDIVSIDGTMQTYTLEITVAEIFDAMKLGFEMGSSNKAVYLDNISMKLKADNVVFNGGFSLGDSTWNLSPGAASIEVANEELAFTDIPGEGDTFSVQAMHVFNEESLDSLYPGPYRVSFDARTSADSQEVHLFFGEIGGSWARYFDESSEGRITVDTTMKKYVLEAAIGTLYDEMQIGFEVNYGPGDFFVDNIVVERIREVAPDAPTVSLSTTDGVVTVSVSAVEGAASYDVFFADSTFTDTDGGALVGTIDPENGLTLEHSTSAPHPDEAFDFTATYGVVAKSDAGTASELTTSSIETGMTTATFYGYELSSEAVTAVSEAVLAGEIPAASALASFFPSGYTPFEINETNGTVVAGEAPGDNEDLSGKFWMGFDSENNQLIFYSEITDESVVYATEADGSGGAWNFDSWEMGIGNYSPNFLQGSDHTTYEAGDEPDYQLRIGGLVDPTDDSERGFVHGYGLLDGRINGEVPNSATAVEKTETGWRALTLVNTAELAGTADDQFDFPTGSDYTVYPLNFAINDADEATRETQIAWGAKSTDGGWWSDPRQWTVVAFVGKDADFVTSNEDGNDATNPVSFSLEQNYPNPFNPTTNINFTLPNATQVTLEVFNMLGQKVATLIENEAMAVGSHTQAFDASNLSSGLYIYRLSAGSSFVQAKKMMLIK